MLQYVILLAFVAVAKAGIIGHHADLIAAPAALVSTGASSQFRSQDNLGNYAFGYNEDHATGGTFRRETGDAHGVKVGSYGLRDADGRLRIVNYVADALGFRANIQTNEPGVEPKDPAATLINKPGLVAPIVEAAPVIAAPAHLHAAPLIAPAPAHLHAAPAHLHAAPLAAPLLAPAHAHYASAVAHAPLLAAPSFAHGHYAHAPLLGHHFY